ncbi:MAG TPA: hypothetical protein VIG08_09010 [Gemmatimonadales bacterium]
MAGLVNGKIEAVEEAVPVRMEQKDESVQREDRGQRQPRAAVQQTPTVRRTPWVDPSR